MAIAFTKINKFVLNLGKKTINLATDQLKIALTNTLPDIATVEKYADLTAPLSTTNLQGANPFDITTVSYAQNAGIAKLTLADLVLTATGAVGPFRYIVLYSDTATNKELLGFYDYGSSISLADTDTFTLNFDDANGALTIQ